MMSNLCSTQAGKIQEYTALALDTMTDEVSKAVVAIKVCLVRHYLLLQHRPGPPLCAVLLMCHL
jgi:hypothetical protein